MRLTQLRHPLQAAAVGTWKPSLSLTAPCLSDLFAKLRVDGGTAAEGRRYASVKSQGAYKLKWKRTIPKKMGAKRTGDQYVIPGNMLYKQRGTIWHPGENAFISRNHTIHAAVSGYVKYYRDPLRHPTRQYIGVTFNREDKLPYPPNAARRRRLGLVATPRKPEPETPDVTGPSGIPLWVVRPGLQKPAELEVTPVEGAEGSEGAENVEGPQPLKPAEQAVQANKSKRAKAKQRAAELRALRLQNRRIQRDTRVLHLQSDYSYREHNWELGRLIGPVGKVAGTAKVGSRKAKLRARRRKRDAHFRRLKAQAAKRKVKQLEYLQEVAEKKAIRAAADAAAAAKEAAKASSQGKEKTV